MLFISGDWHGNFIYANKAIKYAAKKGATTIIQVGDFGIWPNDKGVVKFLSIEETLAKYNINLYFIDGNHENFDWLYAQPVSEDGLRHLKPHITHVPRGTILNIEGFNILFMGGAESTDRAWRTEHISWFSQEMITASDANTAIENLKAFDDKIDIMISHDVPTGLLDRVQQNLYGFVGTTSRNILRYIYNRAKPTILVHGHHHVFNSQPDAVSLACDGSLLQYNTYNITERLNG